MNKWTQGPYTFEQCSRLDGTTVQEWTIEAPGHVDDDEPTIVAGVFTSERDAALLAAAPDLADALERALMPMHDAAIFLGDSADDAEQSVGAILWKAYEQAAAAFAKARGEA